MISANFLIDLTMPLSVEFWTRGHELASRDSYLLGYTARQNKNYYFPNSPFEWRASFRNFFHLKRSVGSIGPCINIGSIRPIYSPLIIIYLKVKILNRKFTNADNVDAHTFVFLAAKMFSRIFWVLWRLEDRGCFNQSKLLHRKNSFSAYIHTSHSTSTFP